MQQSSATPSLHLWFLEVAEDCCMLSILLAVLLVSTVLGTVSSLHPTSYFYTCNRNSDGVLAYDCQSDPATLRIQ